MPNLRGDLRPVVFDCDPEIGIPIAIRVSPQARRVGLRIDTTERRVELVLPRGVPAGTGLRFLAAKRKWIAARLQALPQPTPFVEGAIVPSLVFPNGAGADTNPLSPPGPARTRSLCAAGQRHRW